MLKTVLIIFSFGIIGGLVSGYQIFGLSRDYLVYYEFFDRIKIYGLRFLFEERFEIGFGLLSFLLITLFNSNTLVYGILSGLSLILKTIAIRFVGCGFLVGIIFYMTRYFPLHEMTQLRVALGSGFAILSFVLEDFGKRKLALILIIIGITFHWSVIILLPFLFLYSEKRILLISLITAPVLFFILKYFPRIILRYAAKFFETMKIYEIIGYGDFDINYLPVAILLDASIVIVGIILWNSLTKIMKKIIIAQIFSFSIFYGLIEFPVLAWRIRDLFAVIMIIYVSAAYGRNKILRISAVFYVAISSLFFIYINFLKYPLFDFWLQLPTYID